MLICLSDSLLLCFDHNIHSTFCLLSPFHVSRCCWHPNNVKNRMMTRAFGHNPCCDNQSTNVVLRGEIYLRLSHFLSSSSSPVVSSVFLEQREKPCDIWISVFCYLSHSDDSVTTGGAQPSHDVETLPDQTFITSTQSTLSNGTFCFLFLEEEEGGTQVRRSCGETDSWAGKFTHFIKSPQNKCIQSFQIDFRTAPHTAFFFIFCRRWPGTSSLCEEEQMSSTSCMGSQTELEGKRQMFVADCGQDMRSGHVHRRSHRGHLTCLSPAAPLQANNALLILTAEMLRLSASPVFAPHPASFDWFEIMVVLLSVSPAWLTPLALVGSPIRTPSRFLDPHCPADPPGDIWPLCLAIMILSVQSLFCCFMPINYFTLCSTHWPRLLSSNLPHTSNISRETHVQHF